MGNKKKVIIIGAGTAGITIANNIQNYFNVDVIEKSKNKKYPLIYKIPLFIGLIFRDEKTKYISIRNITLSDGRQIPFFQSNLWGGASIMNGCVHMFGSESQWKSILKTFKSSYGELLESYNSLYSSDQKNINKITLTLSSQNIIDKAFIKSLNQQNIPVGDVDFSNTEACGPILNTVKKYFRTSVLSLIRKKVYNNFLGEVVENILFDNKGQVTGVKTNLRTINSDYVILSGGVIGTYEILSRTKEKNKGKGKDNFNNFVLGENLQDHTNLRINVITNKNIGSLNEISNSFFKKLLLFFKHCAGQSTLLRGTGATSAANLDLDQDGIIDTRIQIVQFTETGRHNIGGKLFSDEPGFSLSITTIYPQSKGRITGEGTSSVIDPMYLSSKKDVELLKLALKYCLNLLQSQPLSDHILKIEDQSVIENNPEKYIKDNIFSGHHLIGGAYEAVNSNFEVHNTKGLYVCDASVFKEYASSNIHSSVVLLADIFSKRFIKINSV